MHHYFTFSSFLNTRMLKTHPSYKINWDHELDMSVSEDHTQTGMVGERITHTEWLKLLAIVTMIVLFVFVEHFRDLDNAIERFGSFNWESSNPHQLISQKYTSDNWPDDQYYKWLLFRPSQPCQTKSLYNHK